MQADAPFRMSPDDFKLWSVRNKQGRDGAVLRLRHVALGLRLAAARALQRRAGHGDQRRGRAGSEQWRGDGRGRAPGGAVAGGLRRRVDRLVLPGAPGRRADAAALRAVAADRLPVPRGAVRELVHPDGGADGGAARHPRRNPGQHFIRHGARRVFPGGDAHFSGSLEQERDPDHRVRQAQPRARHGTGRGHDAGRADPVAPDPDDFAGVRLRRAAARHRDRRRFRGPARHRHRRARRHDRGRVPRPVLHPAVLRRGRAPVRAAKAHARRDDDAATAGARCRRMMSSGCGALDRAPEGAPAAFRAGMPEAAPTIAAGSRRSPDVATRVPTTGVRVRPQSPGRRPRPTSAGAISSSIRDCRN